ncbi:unnamed protein product [Callosobruchus maculatus]|uniref:Glycerate kinase n=1 Tax=Callosobruchus maculatus TaxID=64391 RepID=A0A653BWX2_CALMS|nr:unnamed protein product [Callosobruchus maculatus]
MCAKRVLSVKNLSVFIRKTSTMSDLLEIFQKSVESVQPASLLEKQISVTKSHLVVNTTKHKFGKRCHVIGFGKAVKDMALKMESILGERMQRAVVTVPVGIFREGKPSTRIEFIEGAENNLPDENSMGGALKIKELAQTLTMDDLLIVLVSGGGSALLPLPVPPITLQEKHELIKQLARKGNNKMAASAASVAAVSRGYQSMVVSTCIEGNANCIAISYAKLAAVLAKRLTGERDCDILEKYLEEFESQYITTEGLREGIFKLEDKICLIFAGEPTVVVTGTGKGGRNQQLALNFAIEIFKLHIPRNVKVSFLSCGTDGIDGPTDAAGAISPNNMDTNWVKFAQDCLDNNDAYRFFQSWDGGDNLVKIGHTGTNVMDIHVLVVEKK